MVFLQAQILPGPLLTPLCDYLEGPLSSFPLVLGCFFWGLQDSCGCTGLPAPGLDGVAPSCFWRLLFQMP